MSPWDTGRHEVEQLIASGGIARLRGADAGTNGLMQRARQQLTSATALAESDPQTSYIVAYDAAKHAAMAVLSAQDLRSASAGGHVAMERALTAQFGGVFGGFGRLRRRRNELDYPSGDEDSAGAEEARRAIVAATDIVDRADSLLREGVLTAF